jgi:integrase
MRAKVALIARVKDGARFPFTAVQVKRNVITFPIAWKDEAARTLKHFTPEQVIGFYARMQENGQRKTAPLGKDPVSALTQFQEIERNFARVRSGLLPLNPPESKPAGSRDIHACAKKYIEELEDMKRKPRSVETVQKALDQFLASYRKTSIDEITRQDCLDFLKWMEKNIPRRNNGGHPNNTYRNRLQDVSSFFKKFSVAFPLTPNEWPKKIPKKKEKYSLDTVNRLIDACEAEDEKDLIHFLLSTGFRDDEVAHVQYKDIDFQQMTINIGYKREFNWIPKNGKPREQAVPLSDRLVKRMKNRQKRYGASESDLIFPTAKGTPNQKLLRIIKRVAERAEIKETIGLHKFRKTFGTAVAHKLGLETARIYLGHEDIETTQEYLAADELSPKHTRKMANELFSTVGD